MKKENVLNLVNALMEDYLYFKEIGDFEAAKECHNEMMSYLNKI
jgi:hypothetical protein